MRPMGKRQYYLKLTQGKRRAAKPSAATLRALRLAGAEGLMLSSESGLGIVVLDPRLLVAREAALGTTYEAFLQDAKATKTFGVAGGVVFSVTCDDALASEIHKVRAMPLGSLKYVEIPSGDVGEQEEQLPSAATVAELEASLRRSPRGADIRENGRKLTVSELKERGWTSSG